ncbi:MAG: hypothetical protein K2X93_23755, partial [Candidatus Obscuribacterales bacterium]|nr:hypothetical protein [Candidatus Obscuribacterales bacterium]
DAYSNLTQFFYAGSRSEVVNAASKKVINYLNRFGDVVKTINHLGKVTTTEYDALGRVVKVVEPELNSTEYVYNIDNQQTTVTRKPKTGGGSIANGYTYHATFKNRVATATDGKGLVTTFSYNATTGLLLTIQQPLVGGVTPTTTLTYNSRGQLETGTDPTGVVTKMTYDSGTERVLTVIRDFGTPPHLNLTRSFGHNTRGDVTSITDARGNTTSYQVDLNRRITQVTAPAPFSYVTKITYDANNNITKLERQTNIVATPWQTFERTYAIDSKLLTIKSPTGDITSFEYNNLRQVKKVTDPMSRVVEYVFDDLGRPYTTKDATGSIAVTQLYTDNGKLLSLTDKRGNTTTYSFDEYDRLKRITDADTKWTEVTAYDANSNPLKVTTRDGQVIDFVVDNLNRVSSRTASPTVSYSYDLAGRLLTASKPVVAGDPGSGTFTNFYDSAGRFFKEQYPDTKTVVQDLDANDNVTKLTYPDGYFVQNAFDELNRMTGIKLNGAGTNAVTFGWDAMSRRTSQAFENGASVSYGYALDDAVTDIDHTFVGSSVNFDYSYNANNELASQQVSDAAYMWSPLTSGTTTYGTASSINTYPTVGGEAQQYTNLGALSDNGPWTFSYNNLNQITDASKGGLNLSFKYDPNDRQVEKAVASSKTQFYYGGSLRLADYSAGALQSRYVYGPGGDIAMSVASSGTKTSYHANLEGSVIALSNSTGAATNKYAYSPFGESKTLAGTSHGFLGERYDIETGLHSNSEGRMYESSRARVLTTNSGGSIGFGNVYGLNAQQQPGPSNSTVSPATGLNPAGPSGPWPFSSHPPAPLQEFSIPTVFEIPDPTKGKGGGIGSGFNEFMTAMIPLTIALRNAAIRHAALEAAKAAAISAGISMLKDLGVQQAQAQFDKAISDLQASLRRIAYPHIPPGGFPATRPGAQATGTRFHQLLAQEVVNFAKTHGMQDFISAEETIGKVKLDVVIRDPFGEIISVLDWKTGDAGLTPARIQEIRDALSAAGYNPDVPIREL